MICYHLRILDLAADVSSALFFILFRHIRKILVLNRFKFFFGQAAAQMHGRADHRGQTSVAGYDLGGLLPCTHLVLPVQISVKRVLWQQVLKYY